MPNYFPPPPPFMGGGQPHAPPRLPPVITAVRVDDPPISDGGPIAIPSSIVSIAQPNPWVYTFFGAHQPFQPKKLSPAIPGQSADPPPFLHRARSSIVAELTIIWQPNPWVYAFMGARQPYAPRTLSPSITAVAENNPPFAHPSRSAVHRAIREAWNPPPFDFQMQLYASRATPPRLRPTARGYIIY